MRQALGIIASGILKAVDPFLVSATIEDAAPTDIVMVFNEVVTGTNLGFTIGGTTSTTFASISGSGTNTITGVMADPAISTETVLLSYNDAVGDIIDGDSNPLASFTDTAVTNNITAFDTDAQAFIDAVGTLDSTNQTAINQLVLDLKADSIWAKLLVVNPKAGSTATEHKWNLMDPRNLDAAYRYSYTGSWTHSSGGALADGTSAYADTHLNPSTLGLTGDISFGFYQRTAQTLTNDRHGMGGYVDANHFLSMQMQAVVTYYIQAYASSTQGFNPLNSSPNVLGFYAISVVSTTKTAFHQTETPNSFSTNGTAVPNLNIWEGCLNLNNGFWKGVDMTFGTSFIGEGLTNGEIDDLRTAIVTFETALGRDV